MSIKNKLTNIINDDTSGEDIANFINKILGEGKNFGRSNYGNNKKISIEYTTNFKEFDIDSARISVYGDSLANIMSFAGYDVTREFYIRIDDNSIEPTKKVLDRIRVYFDVFTEEQSLYDNGLIDLVLSKLQRSGKCYIDNGNLWLKTTDLYDEENRILINGDGSYSYLLPEIAYHVNKFDRGFDKVIDIFKDDNHRCIDGLKSGIEFVGYSSGKLNIGIFDKINIINYDENIDVERLIDVIGVNTLRYYLTNIYDNDLDLSLAKSNSMDNPIYYIENAYAKIYSILRGKSYQIKDKYSTINSGIAYTILNKLLEFENIVISASSGRINIICNYLYELASLYYYYEDEMIISDNNDYINDKIILLSSIRIVMNNAANMLGLILREEI